MPVIHVIESGEIHGGDSGRVYYPLWFVRALVSWRRLFMKSRTECIWICVDAVRGVAHRVDSLPNAVEMDVAEEEILPMGFDEARSLDKAGALARWWARTRLHSWWAPAMKFEDCRLYHKAYAIEEDSSGRLLRDTVSGERTSL